MNKLSEKFLSFNFFVFVVVVVSDPAKINRTSKSGSVYPPDAEAKLWCLIDGSPIDESHITWYKDGTIIEQNRKFVTSFVNKTSFLQIVNPGRDEVGKYQCNVNNGISNVTSKPILFITNCKYMNKINVLLNLFLSILSSNSFMIFFLVLISVKPETNNTALTRKAAADRGASVELTCAARGSPMPKFTWHFAGKQLQPNRTDHKYSVVYNEVIISLITN